MTKDNNITKYSAAVTLSDMEIFVFPELMYSVVLANIMSPLLWNWRELSTFKKLRKKPAHRRLGRLRQFIMDEFDFNLDLNTWGLTDKDREIARFAPFISPEKIADSNALFGYHGDEYYFDIGIRRHFGLDKYEGNIIPYWKTETIEAMDAFRYKQGYSSGAGECVSLAALYLAAAYIVCDIPLEDMYMILTPLHSQNYIDTHDGMITNNRRIVTKSMWFNGTVITEKAQRAIRNENVTIVSHSSGHIHCIYDNATINPKNYEDFSQKLRQFLSTDIDLTIFGNFLRSERRFMKYFAFCRNYHGKKTFICAEILFRYEHSSKYRIAPESLDKLFDEVSDEDFCCCNGEHRISVEQFVKFLCKAKIDVHKDEDAERLKEYLVKYMPDADEFIDSLRDFIKIEPKLPSAEKNYIDSQDIKIDPGTSREDIIDYLEGIRGNNLTAELAFYAYRDMSRIDWQPFMVACMERSPVSIEQCANIEDVDGVYNWLADMENRSIYDGKRLAHPDEVVNFTRGDGIEKAITLANVLYYRYPQLPVRIEIDRANVAVYHNDIEYDFDSTKDIVKTIDIQPGDYGKPTVTEGTQGNMMLDEDYVASDF
ncbi:MAG: hypothetical protein ACIAQZ_12365 [Sedimentisphaeraceae bacterium JB056]